jgi:CheY-like chemotaxis protein
MTETHLKVLLLEDDDLDAELVEKALLRSSRVVECRRAKSEQQFLHEFESFRPHLILSDSALSNYSGLSALMHAKARQPEIPFIFVCGGRLPDAVGDEIVRTGSDHVSKEELEKLPGAIEKALRGTPLSEAIPRRPLRNSSLSGLPSGSASPITSRDCRSDFRHILADALSRCQSLSEILRQVAGKPDLEIKTLGRDIARLQQFTHELLKFDYWAEYHPRWIPLNPVLRQVSLRLEQGRSPTPRLLFHLCEREPVVFADPLFLSYALQVYLQELLSLHPGPGELRVSSLYSADKQFPCSMELTWQHQTGASCPVPFAKESNQPPELPAALARLEQALEIMKGVMQRAGGELLFKENSPGSLSLKLLFTGGREQFLHSDYGDKDSKETNLSQKRRKTILLVEPEHYNRFMIGAFLRGMGFDVIEAPGGLDALEILDGDDRPIDLLLTSLTMPGMDGITLAEKIGTARKSTRILFACNRDQEYENPQHQLLNPGANLVPKPYNLSLLAQKLKSLLAGC